MILGVNAPPTGWHDPAACLVAADGTLLAFCEEERLSRAKHRNGHPSPPFRSPRQQGKLFAVRLVLNVIWFVLSGLWLAIGYAFAALICFVLIITIPFGIAALRIAAYALWPFGSTVVKRADAGVASGIGNVIWVLLCGWWLALAHLVTGLLLCLTIIGIPLGVANFKLVPVAFLPLGREIVSVEEAEAMEVMPA